MSSALCAKELDERSGLRFEPEANIGVTLTNFACYVGQGTLEELKMYERYKDVEITNTYFTGGRNAILPTLRRSVAAICRDGRGVEAWYVGIASGQDYFEAIKRRIDKYKIESGITRVYLMYQSQSERNTRSIERSIEVHFKELARVPSLNRTGGGGGRPSQGPHYFVYLAVRQRQS